jgi:hypothetical protein
MSEKKPKDALAGNPAKRGHGNVWEPTQEQKDAAKYLAAVGATEEQVAMHLGVCRDTVRARGREALSQGDGQRHRFEGDGDTACLIFLCKRSGWVCGTARQPSAHASQRHSCRTSAKSCPSA